VIEVPVAWSADAARADDRCGKTVCGWALRTPLARGAVCMSWIAEHATNPQPPAVVRILAEPFSSDLEARAEWLRASWAANRFDHARVVNILEEGADETGAPVVVRRWIDGEDLGRAAARGRIDARAALRIAEQLLDALEMAHAHGIAHGAIHPGNVIVTPRGNVRLVDFATPPDWLARRLGNAAALAAAHVSAFAAPERRQVAPAEQADIWSVASCVYFALSGKAPLDSALAPLRVVAPAVDPDIAAVVDLGLETDPSDRYESAYAMLADVRRVLAGRKPRLESALYAAESHRLPSIPAPPPSAGRASMPAPDGDRASEIRPLDATDARATGSMGAAARAQWRGNVVLVIAIATLVGIASFVMFREKLSDAPDTHQLR
jgi:serine/threonine protein kinase